MKGTPAIAGLMLAMSACTSTSSDVSVSMSLTPVVTTTTLTSLPPTTPPPTTVGATTTTTTPVTIEGTSLADVVEGVRADLQRRFDLGDPPPDVNGPFLVTCADAEITPAGFGDVFACAGLPQADIELDAVGVVMVVVSDAGAARWMAGTDIPTDQASLLQQGEIDRDVHFCRELAQEAGPVFSVGYTGAVAYWFLEGMPERMDADLDGVPCETVFSYEEVLEFWSGLPQQEFLDDPRAAFDFGYVTEVSVDGSSLTIDFAEFLTGEAANEAARAAGDIGPDEDVPNDYFISNENPMLRTFPIASEVTIELIGFFLEGGQLESIAVTAPEWAELFTFAADCAANEWEDCIVEELGLAGWQWYGLGQLPYWILVEDGEIVAIEEQYLP
jgi:hypothetical protein